MTMHTFLTDSGKNGADQIPAMLAEAGIDTTDRAVSFQIMTLVEGMFTLARLTNDVQGCAKSIAYDCERVQQQTAAGHMPTSSWVVNGAKSLAEMLADMDTTAKQIRTTCFGLSLLVKDQDEAIALCARLVAVALPNAQD